MQEKRMSGSSAYDPSKLLLKKELTHIRKAARALRDPGTTSTWKSPLNSSRSVIASSTLDFSNQMKPIVSLHRSNDYDPSPHPELNGRDNSPHLMSRVEDSNCNHNYAKEKEKRVFLYNWKSNKSCSEKSLHRLALDANNNDGSSAPGSAASADDSVSDARNAGLRAVADSKSDTYVTDHHHHRYPPGRYSSVLRCGDMRLGSLASPTRIRRATGRKKSRKTSASLRKQLRGKRVDPAVLGRKTRNPDFGTKNIRSSSPVLSQDDSVSLIDQSDDTAEYCNSEDLREASVVSPLLSRLRQNNWSQSSMNFFRGSRKDDSSFTQSTPALSIGSYCRYLNGVDPSTVGSWDGTTASFNDVDNEADDPLDLPGRQGCGIPCYRSRRISKSRGGCGSCCSPSLSDTMRIKGSRLLCGSQKGNPRCHRSSSRATKQKNIQGVPLLTNSWDDRGSSIGTENSDDELSTNFGELHLESLSRLDGRRWSSSCRGEEGLELMVLAGEGEEECISDNIGSLSQRYRPMFFDELIGQNIVVQSLTNAISRGRIAPVYLFQGPRGTGKTSTAKIFAAALNCLASKGTNPCGICRECTDFISGKCGGIIEVDSSTKKAIDRVRCLMKSFSMASTSTSSRYKVFIIDECHLLPSKTWSAFLKFIEESRPRVVFIFITTDLENIPRAVMSRCQKYLFNKIKDSDIVGRLRKISTEENLDVENDALEMIALNADGSLLDAETMLDQLSLLGKRITASLVNELVGVVSDEKLLELLALAMSSNTTETVKQARELMDSGVDPLALMSQLACLIMDIIAGTYQLKNVTCADSFFDGRSLNETELEKLKHALKLLSDAEKQLRVSNECSTWFTATLLQLGSSTSSDCTLSSSSRRQTLKTTKEDPSSASTSAHKLKFDAPHDPRRLTSPGSSSMLREATQNINYPENKFSLMDGAGSDFKATLIHSVNSVDNASLHGDLGNGNMIPKQRSLDVLDDLWLQCIARCHSNTLRQLLHSHGKILSISENDGGLVAYIAFENEDIKSRAERFIISITNSLETLLRRGVEVRIILLSDAVASMDADSIAMGLKQSIPAGVISKEERVDSLKVDGCTTSGSHQELLKVSRGSSNGTSDQLNGGSTYPPLLDQRLSVDLAEGNVKASNGRQEVRMQRIESIIREQRLESAWLQAAEKGTRQSVSCLRPVKNQVLPQDGISDPNQAKSMTSFDTSSHHWSDELNCEIKALRVNDKKALQKDQNGSRLDHVPMSPSLLHQSNIADSLSKEYQGYESGPGASGCNMLFCWNTKPPRRAKVKNGTSVRSNRTGCFICPGERRK